MVASQTYRILDVEVRLETRDNHLCSRFDQDYSWFRTASDLRETPDLHVVTCLGTSSPTLSINGVSHSLKGHPNPEDQCYKMILQELFRRVRAFLLIHGAVAVKNDFALILSGPAGIGKTTLLMLLLSDGFAFFSDDVCPVERTSGRVFPFPRRAWIGEREKGGKRPLFPHELIFPDHSTPRRAGCVVLLATRESKTDVAIRLLFKDQPPPQFLIELADLGVDISTSPGCQELTIRYRGSERIGGQVRRLLSHHREQIWSASRIQGRTPHFEGKPSIRRLSAGELAMGLAGELKQDFLLPDAALSPGRLLVELSRLFEGVPGYQVTTGRLDRLVEVVRELATETDRG